MGTVLSLSFGIYLAETGFAQLRVFSLSLSASFRLVIGDTTQRTLPQSDDMRQAVARGGCTRVRQGVIGERDVR
ncbi:hypothetical protein [Sphingomonas zeicaulis]|uniref:hypothetical protein n=1 Tax=Sphingomonas zeicaulis TaxID=1632740 RepID=UPI003D1C853A